MSQITLTSDETLAWQALRARHHLPGVFYAVRSTGIYCRTDCPSRRPTASSVQFFSSEAEAEAAGYRPCLRCRPQDALREEADLKRVLDLFEAELLTGDAAALTLAALAERTGFEPSYLRRLFRRDVGLSPKVYVEVRRAERLRAELRQGAPVTEALYGAGYGSTRALYASADRVLGMTPGAYRKGGAGLTIWFACFESDLGPGLVAATERGVCALRFGDGLLEELEAEFENAQLEENKAAVTPYIKAVQAYLAGEPLTLPLDLSPSAFQAKVWTALQRITYGETRSYAEVAEAVGNPAAVRAVAGACAKNPVALAVPCHRVVRADGSLSGYRWGVARKTWLLEREAKKGGNSGSIQCPE